MRSIVQTRLRRSAVFLMVSIPAISLGSLGCGTLVGATIGATIDYRQLLDVSPPYDESLPPLTGKTLRVTTTDGHRTSGVLVGIEAKPRADAIAFVRSQWPKAHVDTLRLGSIQRAQIRLGSHACRNAGVLCGVITDAALVYWFRYHFDPYGGLRKK